MVDYSVCNSTSLREHMCSTMPVGSMSAYYLGVFYEEAGTEDNFRACMDVFIAECNGRRTTAEGYERCEDHDPGTGVITFYVMREDGREMAEISAFFLDEDSNVGFHAPSP